MQLTWQQVVGVDQNYLIKIENNQHHSNFDPFSIQPLIHPLIEQDLHQLLIAASNSGLSIAIISSYRSFERQLSIWNDKWQGERPIYSIDGLELDVNSMSEKEKYHAISLWSALPGLSRHHWGTDLDIFLLKPIQAGYKVELQSKEFSQAGVCHQLTCWMDDNLDQLGFFRPYRRYQQGVSAEPWHISHRTTSQEILQKFPFDHCLKHLYDSKIQSKKLIVNLFENYKKKYFLNLSE